MCWGLEPPGIHITALFLSVLWCAMAFINVTRSDLVRVIRSQQGVVLPTCDEYDAVIHNVEQLSRLHSAADVVFSLVRTALGTVGSLADALDVLDDAGVLAQTVWGARHVGRYELAIDGDGMYPVFWGSTTPRAILFAVEERDGLPVFRFDHRAEFTSARTVTFHTGAEAYLLADNEHNTLGIHPLDDENIRGCWRVQWDLDYIPEVRFV
jgi:hypothetical protein